MLTSVDVVLYKTAHTECYPRCNWAPATIESVDLTIVVAYKNVVQRAPAGVVCASNDGVAMELYYIYCWNNMKPIPIDRTCP